MNGNAITERQQQLLRTLVGLYIREGQPVGSRTLVQESGIAVSPATVRSIMADLEERGFVTTPHTSAGRVPTSKGYRLFIDTLITMKPLPAPALMKRIPPLIALPPSPPGGRRGCSDRRAPR